MRTWHPARLAILALIPLSSACVEERPASAIAAVTEPVPLELTDRDRGRLVPVLLFGSGSAPRRLALISHGYGGNNRAYSFIARHLARQGFLVASVQHELPGDPELPTGGIPAVVRRPSWLQGGRNLEFVARELRARRLATDAPVVLIGHSHGGDASVLLATMQPRFARALFTLDNRRATLPRTSRPRICTVRSVDQPADAGVLPSPAEAQQHRMVVVTVPGLRHNNMWDVASDVQKRGVLDALDRCLDASRR
jgi:pimeloyl-ACP methyl ester carboxylesterase